MTDPKFEVLQGALDAVGNIKKEQRAEKLDAIGDKAGGVLDSAMGAVGTFGPMIKNAGKGKSERMDDRGNLTHKVNTGGNIMGGAAAGAKIGSNFGPWGTVIGAGAGALAGGITSIVDKNNQPTLTDLDNKQGDFNMKLGVGSVVDNSTIPEQAQAAETGFKSIANNKPMEVEKDEVVLRPQGKTFKKVADFKGGKTHEEGGEPYQAQKGDIIIPGKKRHAVDQALRLRDWRRIESIRQTLPTDTGQTKFEDGVKEVKGDTTPKLTAKQRKVQKKFDAFLSKKGVREKVLAISKKHGFSPERLMSLMYFETAGSMSPGQKAGWRTWKDDDPEVLSGAQKAKTYRLDKNGNKQRISSATGLIQFMKATAKELGTSTEALAKMDVLEQLDWVEKYYDKHHKFGDDPYDTVMASGAGEWEDDHIIYKKGSDSAKDNPAWQNAEGNVTKASARAAVPNYLPDFKVYDKEAAVAEATKASEEKVASMRAANKEAQGYDDYEKYVEDIKAAGGEPESREWYEWNVAAPIEEQQQGYWNARTPRGRRAYDADGVKRDDLAMEDLPKSRSQIASEDNQILSIGDDYLPGNQGKMADIDKVFSKQFDRLRRGLGIDESEAPDAYTGFSDPKLEEEAMKFYEHARNNTTNGTLAGRKLIQAGNFIDATMVEALGGSGQVSTAIANMVGGEDVETITAIINDAKQSGAITEKGEAYLWDLVSDPEAFKTQEAEAVEDINVAMLMKDAPKMLLKGGKSLSKFAKSKDWKGMINKLTKKGWTVKNKDGTVKLTAKGLKGVRESKAFKLRMEGAKHNPKIKRQFQKSLEGMFDNGFTGAPAGTMDELAEMAKQAEKAGIKPEEWSPSIQGAMDFFKSSYNTFKKLPNTIRKKMVGKSYAELNKMQKQLVALTGKSAKELENMSHPEMAKLITDTRKGKWDVLQDAIKAKEDAWKAYEPLREESVLAKKLLKKLERSGIATADQIDKAVKRVQAAEAQVKSQQAAITKADDLTQTNWDQIAKVESWMETGDTPYNWRNLVKGEKAIAKHLDNIDDADEWTKLQKGKVEQWNSIKVAEDANLTGLKADQATNNKNISSLQKVLDDKAALFKEWQSKNLAAGRAQRGVNAYEETGLKINKLHQAILADKEIADAWKAGTMTAAEAFNILRKKGSAIEGVTEEDVKAFTEEEIEEAKKVVVEEPEVVESDDPLAPDNDEDTDPGDSGDPVVEGKVEKEDELPSYVPKETPTIGERLSGGFDALASYAPAMYNMVKGLEKPDKVNRRFVKPQTREFQPMAQPQLNAIDNAFEAAIGNARNLSGGLASNFRSNTEKAWADKIARTGQVNAQEAVRADQVAGENIASMNRAEEFNTQAAAKYDQMDMQSEAATNSFLAQGVQDIANIGSRNRKDAAMGEREKTALKFMETNNFKWSDDAQNFIHSGGTANTATTTTAPKNDYFSSMREGLEPIKLSVPTRKTTNWLNTDN